MEKRYYTIEGFRALKNELDYLKNTRRSEIVKEIEVAKGFGDLSENAEYDEARTEQAKTEARIKELEEKIWHAEIIDNSDIDTACIGVGSTVVVFDPDMEEEDTYIIVGSNEVSALENKISDLSPIGKALMGHYAGDTITVEAPKCTYELEIRKVGRLNRLGSEV